jgi:hypothetical protein
VVVAKEQHVLPSQARAKLLREHERLRSMLRDALALAARLRAGEPVQTELEALLDRLGRAFAAHNRTEEALLEPILHADPAWGPARVARMLEEHAGEHAAMRAALSGSALDVAARLPELSEEIDAHMAAEERTFLSPGVLLS